MKFSFSDSGIACKIGLTALTVILLISTTLSLNGCGGNSGSQPTASPSVLSTAKGRATFSIRWPNPAKTSRLIPVASSSIKITVRDAANNLVQEQTIDRPATRAEFVGLYVGDYTTTATAYPEPGAQGVAQATGGTPLHIDPNVTATVNLTLGSTIKTVTVAPANPNITTGANLVMTVTATDETGATVLVAAGALRWVSSNSGVAAVNAGGIVTGAAPGTTEIKVTDTESGLSGATTVAVTPAPTPTPTPTPDPNAKYTITDLGDLVGTGIDTVSSQGEAINNLGQVAGKAYGPDGNIHAFLWTPGGTNGAPKNRQMRDLGFLGGGAFSDAHGLNDAGAVCGEAKNASLRTRAFEWIDGQMSDLGTFAQGGANAIAWSINNHAQITGSCDNKDGFSKGFLWSQQLGFGGMQTIESLVPKATGLGSGIGFGSGRGINDNLQIATNGFDKDGFGGFVVGWNNTDNYVSIGRLNKSDITTVYAINSFSQVVGDNYFASPSTSGRHAVLFYVGGLSGNLYLVDLGTLSNDITAGSSALAINGDATIVGWSGITTGGGTQHAFIYAYNGDRTMYDLNALIPRNSGWILSRATGINDQGQITGYGSINGGVERGFLLTPIKK